MTPSVASSGGPAPVIRAAQAGDASAMAAVINPIIARGGTTAHRDAFDSARITATFIAPPRLICCLLAERGGTILGFQTLERIDPDWPGEDALPADWAIISTFVSPPHHGCGIGRALFARTLPLARAAGVRAIDATIQRENIGGQAFYARLGFLPHAERPSAVSTCLRLSG